MKSHERYFPQPVNRHISLVLILPANGQSSTQCLCQVIWPVPQGAGSLPPSPIGLASFTSDVTAEECGTTSSVRGRVRLQGWSEFNGFVSVSIYTTVYCLQYHGGTVLLTSALFCFPLLNIPSITKLSNLLLFFCQLSVYFRCSM